MKFNNPIPVLSEFISYKAKYVSSRQFHWIYVLFASFICFSISCYWLAQGLTEFSGNQANTIVALSIVGVLYQVGVAVCLASVITIGSHFWKGVLITLGLILFSFSVGAMILGKHSGLERNVNQHLLVSQKLEQLKERLVDLELLIQSYRQNAAAQLQSDFADSQKLGKDSQDRASSLDEDKFAIASEMAKLAKELPEKNAVSVNWLEQLTGHNQQHLNFISFSIFAVIVQLAALFLLAYGLQLLTKKE